MFERIPDTFVVAPEYKITDFGNQLGQLAGVHVGRLLDETLFIGGAIYWLANGSHDTSLGYGGVMVGWLSPAGNRIRFGGRGLAGIGTATLDTNVAVLPRGGSLVRFGRRAAPVPAAAPIPTVVRVQAHDDFAFVEPEATVLIRITDHIAANVSAGYRFAAFEDVLRGRVDGSTGSFALQLGW